MVATSIAHPLPDRLAAFGWGQLGELEAASIETHLAECDTCSSLVAALPDNELLAALREVPAGDDSPVEDVTLTLNPVGSGSPTFNLEEIEQALRDHPRYHLGPLQGRGGMGRVYRADHRLMERAVAIKVIEPRLVNSPAAADRFRREVRVAARLNHPNVVASYDADQAGPAHFLVMEFVDGTRLDEVVRRNGPLPVKVACRYARQAALGLQHAHEHDLVHRDVKPQNLMLARNGEVKILDFGLARLRSEVPITGVCDSKCLPSSSVDSCTQAGTHMGTADYMAPEQGRDPHAADIRADVYSLGCTLYFLLTGQVPAPCGSIKEKLEAHAAGGFRPVGQVRPGVPTALSRVVARMMATNPVQRYQTPREVAVALEQFTGACLPRRRGIAVALATCLALLLALVTVHYGPAAYRFVTNQGQLVVETDDPDVEVIVRRNGEQVAITDLKAGRTINLKVGNYELHLAEEKPGLKLSTRAVALERGGKQIVRVWLEPCDPLATGEVRLFEGCEGVVMGVDVSRDGRYVLAAVGGEHDRDGNDLPGTDYGVRVWERATGRLVSRCRGHTDRVWNAVFSPDGKNVYSASHDRTLRAWNFADGSELWKFECDRIVARVAISPDGSRGLAGLDGGTIIVFDPKTGKELRRVHHPNVRIWGLAFASDGKKFVSNGFWESGVRVWETETGKELGKKATAGGFYWSIAATRDGTRLVTGGCDKVVRVWDLLSGKELCNFLGHASVVRSVAISEDGRLAASASGNPFDETAVDCNVRVWDLETRKQVQCFEGHRRPIWGLCFTPPGDALVSGAGDRTVRLWKLSEMREIPAQSMRQKQLADQVASATREMAAHPHNTAVRLKRGQAHAELGQYQEAAADFSEAIRLGNDHPRIWYQHALLCAWAGDTEGYHKRCGALLEKFGKQKGHNELHHTLWAAVLQPGAVADYGTLVSLAEQVPDMSRWMHLNREGAVLLRAGRPVQAAAKLMEARQSQDKGRENIQTLWDALFLAQTYYELKKPAEAERWLGIAKDRRSRIRLDWAGELQYQLLLQEDERTISRPVGPKPSEKK